MVEKERKGKKIRTGRKHASIEVHKFYEVKGESLHRKKKTCPRCGQGTFLSEHKGRQYCGKCAYTVFEKKEQKA